MPLRLSLITIGFGLIGIMLPMSCANAQPDAAQTPRDREGRLRSACEDRSGRDLGITLSWRTAAILGIGGLAAAASLDHEDPDRMARALESATFKPVMDVGNAYGEGYILGGGIVAIAALGHFKQSENLSHFGLDLGLSFVYTNVVTKLIKFSVDRRRPSGGHLSFPSGHTSNAFSVVPVIAHYHGWKAGLPALALATVTGMARLEERRHYLSDVLFGAAIGLATGDAVVRNRKAKSLVSRLVVTSDHLGLAFRF
jgi:membrane-associated phospholipid phosphatase